MERFPDFPPAFGKLAAELPLRRLPVEFLQRRFPCKGIEKVSVKADSRLLIDKTSVPVLIQPAAAADQGKKRIQQTAVKKDGSRVKIHISLFVDRRKRIELLLGLFM